MKWDNQNTDELCRAILTLNSKAEVKKFLRDLMTEEEIIECGQRWSVARLLNKETSYLEIQSKTGMSPTTIARISSWLKKGTGGYRVALDRINHHTQPS
ncbi:MAG: YerC/YecD family TrpR-related protein [Patescibacteria group bacterium]|jgi:TrpR-related protein YerC/YecD